MKTIKNWLLTGLMLLVVSTVFSQGKVTGTITDGQGALPGANITVKGTKITASTDFNGKFSINSTVSAGEIVVSFIGFEAKTFKYVVSDGATTELEAIVLTSDES